MGINCEARSCHNSHFPVSPFRLMAVFPSEITEADYFLCKPCLQKMSLELLGPWSPSPSCILLKNVQRYLQCSLKLLSGLQPIMFRTEKTQGVELFCL